MQIITMDKRHIKRQKLIQLLYQSFFQKKFTTADNIDFNEIKKHENKFNTLINEYAIKHSSDKLSKIDKSILYLALYEMIYFKKVPVKVILNESIELAKEFGGENSPAFINAVLGAIAQKLKLL